jgi:DNA-binding LacI/PurR family transcriptional regulator
MRRIGLAVILTLSFVLAPAAAEAQPSGKIYRIGVLCPTQCVPTNPVFSPFRQGLEDYGWIEGQTLITADAPLARNRFASAERRKLRRS